jgi:two-component system sensor histidine kinase BaeS
LKPNHRRQHGHWRPGEEWPYRHGPSDWSGDWRRKRQGMFFRFAGAFGFIILLILGGMAALAFLLTRLFGGDGQTALFVWITGCGLALALPLLAIALGTRMFRRYATPVAGVMAAADAVAEGDLSVRLDESGPRDFRQLARSFNHMTRELEQAERRRRNLTADVAHELRTPLHIIQGNLEGILDGVYEPTPGHIQATLNETALLSRLVEDLNTLSLAEAGELELVREPVDVAELLADVRTSFSGQAEAAGIALEVGGSSNQTEGDPQEGGPQKGGPQKGGPEKGGPEKGLILSADVGRLDQVLSNLVANAIRHTPAGGRITLDAEPLAAGVRLSVSDTGQGISPEELPYVFDRFWRGDPSRSHKEGSLGLGLAIAQQLVEAHDGQIVVESEWGQGTTFTIELPADVA